MEVFAESLVLIKHIDLQLPRGLCVMSFCAVGQYKHHFAF